MAKKSDIVNLKMQLIDINDELEIAKYTIKEINKIISVAIKDNIRKTNKIENPQVIRAYREELLNLRTVEKELRDYEDRIGENIY